MRFNINLLLAARDRLVERAPAQLAAVADSYAAPVVRVALEAIAEGSVQRVSLDLLLQGDLIHAVLVLRGRE